jgi:excinuclease ABC subunit B
LLGHRELQPPPQRHAAGRAKPYTLIDYFPDDYLLVIDESHATIPQVRAMFNGDRAARRQVLVEHGFRLPSALDNRPLRSRSSKDLEKQCCSSRRRPGTSWRACGGEVVEQIIRPTGLLDPVIEVRPGPRPGARPAGAIQGAGRHRRTRAGDHADQAAGRGSFAASSRRRACVQWLHSELDTRLSGSRLLRDCGGALRVLVGVNLLREGLDLPEVSLVAILDADKEGFLRSETSLIQTIGRAARNVNAKVILYADTITDSMRRAMDETERRRARLRDRIQEIEAQEDQATVPSTMLDVDQSIGKKRKGTKGRRKPSPRT